MMTTHFRSSYKMEEFTEEEVKWKLDQIVAIHEHEGVTPSPKAQQLALQVLQGEIEGDEAVKQLL